MTALLGLAVSGAPLASRAAEVVRTLDEAGWTTTVVVSDAARQWTDVERRGPAAGPRRPEHIVACPLTFNTGNKIATGIMDNAVTGVLCDGLGSGAAILAVPFVNDRLWRHPAWTSTLQLLSAAGVVLLDPHTGAPGPGVAVRSGTGEDVVDSFDPAWLVDALGG